MVHIKSIIRRMNQGHTGPYLCIGSDENYYVVKGPNTTYEGLINEWVCAHLGKLLGLPIPDFNTVYIDRTLLQYSNYDFYEGEWFASSYQENIQDIPYQSIHRVDQATLKLLFVFDYWINNSDRTLTEKGGNPNLFISANTNNFFVLDHNLAFDKDYENDFQKNIILHLASSSWYAEQIDFVNLEAYKNAITIAWKNVDQILESIPNEWIEKSEENGILDNIRLVLSRCETTEFWEGIK